jgi:DNA-binding CsgD family transcriptional regulator
MAFTSEEVELCLQIARDASLGKTVAERLQATTESLTTLIPGASVSVVIIDKSFGKAPNPGHLFVRNFSLEDLGDYALNYMKHDPMHVVYLEANGLPSNLSDFVTPGHFGADPFTAEFCPKAHIRHVMGCVHEMPDDLLMGLALHRERGLSDFSPRERELLRLVSPDIARGCFGSILREKLAPPPAIAAEPHSSGAAIFSALGDVLHADAGARALASQVADSPGLADLFVADVRRLAEGQSLEGSFVESTHELVDGRWLRVRFSPLESGPRGKVIAVLEVLAPGSKELFETLCARAQLSPRERDVARLAASGCGNREIARELGISPVTVNVHLGHIYAKTGAPNRTELAALLFGGAKRSGEP